MWVLAFLITIIAGSLVVAVAVALSFALSSLLDSSDERAKTKQAAQDAVVKVKQSPRPLRRRQATSSGIEDRQDWPAYAANFLAQNRG